MEHVRGDLSQRLKHKSPGLHCRMRNGQAEKINDLITEKDDVDIDWSGAALFHSNPSHGQLHGENFIQKYSGLNIGIQRYSAIYKPWLNLVNIYGFGFIHTRLQDHITDVAQARNGITQVGYAVAHIRSQREINSLFHPCSPLMIVLAEGPTPQAQ